MFEFVLENLIKLMERGGGGNAPLFLVIQSLSPPPPHHHPLPHLTSSVIMKVEWRKNKIVLSSLFLRIGDICHFLSLLLLLHPHLLFSFFC